MINSDIATRRQQDDFIYSIVNKAQENDTNNFIVGKTKLDVIEDSLQTTVLVTLDSGVVGNSSSIECRLGVNSRTALRGTPAGTKVLVGKLSNLYIVIDVIL